MILEPLGANGMSDSGTKIEMRGKNTANWVAKSWYDRKLAGKVAKEALRQIVEAVAYLQKSMLCTEVSYPMLSYFASRS